MGGGDDKTKAGGVGSSAVDGGEAAQYSRTYQGIPSYPPPRPPSHPNPSPAIGFPLPVPPSGTTVDPSVARQYYAHGYQTVPGYAIVDGRPLTERRLPCCGMGYGWFLFIIGFFLAAIPWYLAVLVLVFSRVDYREKPGYVTCTIMAILATIAIVFGITNGDWDLDWH